MRITGFSQSNQFQLQTSTSFLNFKLQTLSSNFFNFRLQFLTTTLNFKLPFKPHLQAPAMAELDLDHTCPLEKELNVYNIWVFFQIDQFPYYLIIPFFQL